jgi:hypothetical protein
MTSPFEIFRSQVTLRRFQSGVYTNGRWIDGSYTDTQISSSIQPMKGEEMQELPEARRDSEGYKLFTSTLINTVTAVNPDLVLFFGKTFEVVQVFPWQNAPAMGLVNHYKYIVLRLEGQ